MISLKSPLYLVEHGGIRHQGLEVGPDLPEGRVDLVLGVRGHPLAAQVALGDLLQARDDVLQVVREAVHGPGQVADLVLAVHLQSHAQVPPGHLLHHVHALHQGVRDGLGEDPAHDDGEEHGDAHDDVHEAAGTVGHDRVVVGGLLGQLDLHALEGRQVRGHLLADLGDLRSHEGLGFLGLSGPDEGQDPFGGSVIAEEGVLVFLEGLLPSVGQEGLLEGCFDLGQFTVDVLDLGAELIDITC